MHSDGGSYKPLNWMSPPCRLTEQPGKWTVTNKAGETLTITLDLSQRTGTTSALTHVSQTYGDSLTLESSAANVASAPVAAAYLAGNQAVLRLVGPTSVRLAL